jgi:Uma2 family endonuclease
MTSGLGARIAPDDAFVLDPKHLFVNATGQELAKLFPHFCEHNSMSAWQFELSPDGEIIIMPPTKFPSGSHESDMDTDLRIWCRDFGGVSTGASAGYQMSDGSVLSPDAAWVSPERWENHTQPSGEWILLCPDFVVEIRSRSNNLAPLQVKMRLYLDNGARLGWLIDPSNRRVYVYRAGQEEPEILDDPKVVEGGDVLPGFTFQVARWIFDVT